MDGSLILRDTPPAAEPVHVSSAPHPFKAATADVEIPEGLTLAEILELVQPSPVLREHAHIFVGAEYIPRAFWPSVRPRPGALVSIRVVPGGGRLLRTILTIGVIAATLVFAAPLGAALVGAGGLAIGRLTISAAAIGGAIISFAGGLLINAIAPIRPPSVGTSRQVSNPEESPSFFIDQARNHPRPYAPIPVIFGKHRVVPPLGALPITEVVGDDHHLRMIVVWGYGPLRITDLRIGETPIADFDDVRIQTREGRAADAPITIYPDDVHQENLAATLTRSGGWVTRRSQAGADELSVDVALPRGLAAFNRKGKRVNHEVQFQIQYRKVGTPAWVNVINFTSTSGGIQPDTGTAHITLTGARTQPIRYGFRWDAGERAQYDIRLQRVSDDDPEDVDSDEKDPESIVSYYSELVWSTLRTISDRPPVDFPKGLAMTAIDIRASDQLAGVVDELNAIVEAEALDWNGNAWATGYTRNPASAFRLALQHPGRRVASPPDNIDLDVLEDFHEFCDANGYKFDYIHDTRRSILEVLQDICAVGRASPQRIDGKWSVVFDSGTQIVRQHFTELNSRGFAMQRSYAPAPHGLRLTFPNEDAGWKRDERIVYDDNHDDSNATIVPTLNPVGITNRDHIYKFGRFQLAQTLLRRELWTLETGFEYLVARRGSRVTVQHPTLSVGLAAARVKRVTENGAGRVTGIELDAPIQFPRNVGYSAKVRTVGDQDVVGAITVVGGVDTDPVSTLAFSAPLAAGVDVEVGALLSVGETDVVTIDGLVTGIEPADELTARLSIVPYQEGIYNAETGAIPAFDSKISGIVTSLTMVIVTVVSDETAFRLIGNVYQPGIRIQVRPVTASEAQIECEIRATRTAEAYKPADVRARARDSIEIGGVEVGRQYDLRLRWSIPGGATGAWAYEIGHEVLGTRPPAPSGFGVDEEPNATRAYTWTVAVDPDIAGVRIRYSADENEDWADMTELYAGLLTASPSYSFAPGGGTWHFEIRAVNTDGEESSGVRLTTTLAAPPQGRDLRWRGPWASGTDYVEQDGVSFMGHSFVALRDHTSDSSNQPNADGTANLSWGPLAIAGLAGEDADGFEWIFARTAGATIPANQRPLNSWGYDSPGARNGLQWHDGAPGLDEINGYLWVSKRDITGSPAIGAAVGDSWTTPVVLSRWGVNGADGVAGANGEDGEEGADGLGYEYVFTVTPALSIPNRQRPLNSWGFDTPGTVNDVTWDDAAPSISETNPYLWRCFRRVPGGTTLGQAVGANWSTPRIVGRYGLDGSRGVDGVAGTDGSDGDDGDPGSDGSPGSPGSPGGDGTDGTGIEYIFARTSGSRPSSPSNSYGYDNPTGSVWSDAAPSLTSSLHTLWRCERDVPGGTTFGQAVSDSWSTPAIVGHYGNDGEDGAAAPRQWTRLYNNGAGLLVNVSPSNPITVSNVSISRYSFLYVLIGGQAGLSTALAMTGGPSPGSTFRSYIAPEDGNTNHDIFIRASGSSIQLHRGNEANVRIFQIWGVAV